MERARSPKRKPWWKRAWKRHPKIMRPLARLTAGLWRVDLRGMIEGVFRYIQMVTVLSILALLIGIVEPTFAKVVEITLTIAAGLYISIPVGRWFLSMLPARQRNLAGKLGQATVTFMFAVGVCGGTISSTGYLRALISATVRVDENEARRRYVEWSRDQMERGCIDGRVPHSWVLECLREIEPRIKNLSESLPPQIATDQP